AHRFGITFHRKKRNKGTLITELENIRGIGKTTAEKLLRQFKSVKKIKEASEEELRTFLTLKQLNALREYFNENQVTANNENEIYKRLYRIASPFYYFNNCFYANLLKSSASAAPISARDSTTRIPHSRIIF